MQEKLEQVTTCHLKLLLMFTNHENLFQQEVSSTTDLDMPQTGICDEIYARETMISCTKTTIQLQLQRLNFPEFNGWQVKEWLYKCSKVFGFKSPTTGINRNGSTPRS